MVAGIFWQWLIIREEGIDKPDELPKRLNPRAINSSLDVVGAIS